MDKNINRMRALIENVRPNVDGGLYPIKREVGDVFRVEADIFRDGHQKIVAKLNYRYKSAKNYTGLWMECTNPGLDLWAQEFKVEKPGFYEYYISAWCDDYGTWILDTAKKVDAQVEYDSDILEGIELAKKYLGWLGKTNKKELEKQLKRVEGAKDHKKRWEILSNPKLVGILELNPDPASEVKSQVFLLRSDRLEARFAAWYECFPRSCAFEAGKHGTFLDVIKRLDHISKMGFDVLYFPPIHPVGFTKRKGPNNSLVAGPMDPGCPYSIGSKDGGHDAVEAQLGTMKDFELLVQEAKKYGIEIALDFAINCSPDHPYLKEHEDWFSKRPDGTIKFAENPPKKYEDIYPIDFETKNFFAVWKEMLRIFLFWADKGVRIFRVDNPHTKPFAFWKWVIAEAQAKYPDLIFLSEAFTRPKVMKALAKLGFTQSYSYFTWRNEKEEIIEYFEELTTPPESDFYRANLFANTPDIFPPYLQTGGRAAYKVRAILAATLSTVYGIFQGFELCEGIPIPGREEYYNSDKYQIRFRDWNAPGNIIDYITKLNRFRKENPALQEYDNLRFYEADNSQVLFYGKSLGNNHIFAAVNLDPFKTHAATVQVPIEVLGIGPEESYLVEDLITGEVYTWKGSHNYVMLNPEKEPAHLLRIKR